MDLLPQVRAEDLDQRNFESGNLPVHEDARQVQLDLRGGFAWCGGPAALSLPQYDSSPSHEVVGSFLS